MARLTVLVVEDDPLVLMVAAETLRDAGLPVVEVESADRAHEILDDIHEDVAVVFTDIDTPGILNGLDLASSIKEKWPQIEVILASGNPVAHTERVVMVRFFPKPYDLDQIADLIRSMHLSGCDRG